MPTVSPEIIKAKEAVETKILQMPGVTGIDVGLKEVGGQLTDVVAIRVHVRQKKQDVPDAERIPAEIDGYPTDVIEAEYFPAACVENINSTRYAQLCGGISGGPSQAIGGDGYVGTLGVVITDDHNNFWMLSNAHVLNPVNVSSPSYSIVQPALNDGGQSPHDVIGTVTSVILAGSPTNVDAGLVSINARSWAASIVFIGPVAGQNTAQFGGNVMKYGRTTGITYGIVESVNASIQVPYPNLGTLTFTNQICIRPDTSINNCFAMSGDSGSAVCNMQGKVVGLFFAVTKDGRGLANQISTVMNALNGATGTYAIFT